MERLPLDRICRGLGGWAGGPGCLGVHAGAFFLGATALTLLNVARSPYDLWFWRPLAWWGPVLALHAGLVFGGAVRRGGAARSGVDTAAPMWRRSSRSRPTVSSARPMVGVGRALAGARMRLTSAAAHLPATGATPSRRDDDAVVFASWARATDAWVAAGRATTDTVLAGAGWRGRLDAFRLVFIDSRDDVSVAHGLARSKSAAPVLLLI